MTTRKWTRLPFAVPLTVEVAGRREHNSKPWRGNAATNRLKERSMNIERKPVAYGDLRGWIKALHAAGDIRQIDAEVD